ncbi:MAG: alkaline phosphatase family protein [Pirellulaceae bacterium]|nr:alkaline phosphatase family protein [Pirellulaceae bacterium]
MLTKALLSRNRLALVLLSVWAAFQWIAVLSVDPQGSQQAYIGPGAGIALMGSFLAIFIAILSAFVAILTWPIRRIGRALRGQRALRDAKAKRVVILGLDGLEPTLTERFMAEGLLPNLAALAEQGTYQKLGTTCPPLSPVAWSSFATGANPGKHNIFDFIRRDPSTYLPAISSVHIAEPRRKVRLGPYEVPLSRPSITQLRKSKPFWTVLGEAGIFSAVIRVPITFPPDRFHGVELSAMCVPDLVGTQGTFTYYTDRGEAGATTDGDVGGVRVVVERNGTNIHSYLRGPVNTMRRDRRELRLPFKVAPARNGAAALMTIDSQRIQLPCNAFSDWVRVSFPLAPGVKARGICRFYLKQHSDRFDMYCTPVQIDPDKPVMPIAHPTVYSSYLARRQGSFATLGLAEDTWSLSEGLLSEDAFLDQAYDIHRERQTMFFDALDRVRQGMITCVFDGPDRIQHMFFRFIDVDHPALHGRANTHEHAIRDMYQRMDDLVGQTMARMNDQTALFVLSDHGFKPFRRGVDLNAWLLENGYLSLKDNATKSDRTYLKDVDWSQTRAYAIGLAGIYVNQKGREANGIVERGKQASDLVDELAEKLTGLRDPHTDQIAIHEAVPARKAYQGPYATSAPDLIIGYGVGYRVSWDAAVGKAGPSVLSDNTKAWSGDHCIHPDLVPGVLFTNLKLKEDTAHITDIAPTALDLLGVARPSYMDGRSLL